MIWATLLWCPWSQAELMPAERKTDWTPGVMVGVPGGIPNRTKLVDVTQSPYNADRNGGSDASKEIQKAIDQAGANDVIYLPAGTYRIESGPPAEKQHDHSRRRGWTSQYLGRLDQVLRH